MNGASVNTKKHTPPSATKPDPKRNAYQIDHEDTSDTDDTDSKKEMVSLKSTDNIVKDKPKLSPKN